jgi:hypothetical protein
VSRLSTWILVAGLGLLGLLAAVDAFRGGGSGPVAAETRADTQPARTTPEVTDTAGPFEQLQRLAAGQLAEQGVEGQLLLSDSDCVVRGLALPSLDEVPPPLANGCRLEVAPGGAIVGADGTVPGPDGILAECIDDGIVVRPRGRTVTVPGDCPPAWTPDGRLTVVAGGELREVDLACTAGDLSCTRVLLGRKDVARAMGGLPWEMGNPVVREAAWLDDDRVAVIVHDGAQNLDTLAVFRGRELLGAPPFLYESLSDLRASPRGGHAAALLNGRALVLVDGRGEYESLTFRGATGIAWSPDERWTATASSDGVFIFGTDTRGSGSVFLPGGATDVAWVAP